MTSHITITALIFLGLSVLPAAAQLSEDASDSGTLMQLRPGMLVLSDDECRILSRHVPAPDVAYQPGVDVSGNPVTPADLGGASYALQITDVVTYDLLTKLEPDGILQPEGSVGRIAVDVRTGDVMANGQLLTSAEERALLYHCRNQQAGSDSK